MGERLRRLTRASALVRLVGRALPAPLVVICYSGGQGGAIAAFLALPVLFASLLPALWELDSERDRGRNWGVFTAGLVAAALAGAILGAGQAAYLAHLVEAQGLSPWTTTGRASTELLAAWNVGTWAFLFAGPLVLGAAIRQRDSLESGPLLALAGAMLLSLIASGLWLLRFGHVLGLCELLTLAVAYLLASMVLSVPAFLADRMVEWASP